MKSEKMSIDSQIKIFRILFVSSISLTLIWLMVTLAISSKSRPVKISVWQGIEGHKKVEALDTRNRKHLKSMLRCKDSDLKMEILFRGDHWILQNMISGLRSRKMGCAEAITFVTVADFSYLMHLETLVERWMGPISLALFAPGDDFYATMNAIQYARLCLPISKLVRDYVTFHIYFPSGHLPVDGIPRTPLEALKWPANCSEPYAPYENVRRRDLYWHGLQLGLPINLGRNVARRSINTHYALVADIELYPSKDFIPQFFDMISRNTSLVTSKNRHVFAVPAFDLDHHAMVPDTKEDLMTMYNMGMAMEMHHRSCSYCQLIPEEQKWLE
ncbi:beta-1,4-glucuronyltransferase 1, partial [Musca domestica]|uniref:Beta-1,4-glucuronyltransferase 1 n=1 Tax=Musca domestica TaxID=7370 RepID=A0ABM3V8D8_MUSDO